MADQQYDNNLRGVLFHNDKEGNDKRPDLTGNCEIDGTKYRIAAWNKISKTGNQFLSISLSLDDGNTKSGQTSYAAQAPSQPAQPAQQATVDDGIPF